jgi:RNA polymerase sigma factor (sigma-70 family)
MSDGEERYVRERARIEQGHVKYREKLRAEGKLFVRDRLTLLLDPETEFQEDWERVMIDPGMAPDERARRAEERERILRALSTLPAHQRTIIMLSDLEGLSYREIAEVLGIPMGTVMSRLHNARKRLRRVLGPILGLLLSLVAAAALVLADPPVILAQQQVRFGARVLRASDTPPPVGSRIVPGGGDERLEQFMPRLHRLFRYKEYASLGRFRAEVPVGTTQRWSLPGDRTLELTPESVTGNTVRLRLRLQRGGASELTTSLQAASGAPAVIGGPRHDDGVLIIIVWAHTGPR